jgi:hypothetical protein
MGVRYYIGHKRNGTAEVFGSKKKPTEATHGDKYSFTTGPFPSKARAVDGKNYGYARKKSIVHKIANERSVKIIRKLGARRLSGRARNTIYELALRSVTGRARRKPGVWTKKNPRDKWGHIHIKPVKKKKEKR